MFKFKAHKSFLDYLISSLIVILPLVCSVMFRDYYVVTKWAVLFIFMSIISLSLGFRLIKIDSLSIPVLSKREIYLIVAWAFFLLLQLKYINHPSFLDFALHITLPFIFFLIFNLNQKDYSRFFFQRFLCSLVMSI